MGRNRIFIIITILLMATVMSGCKSANLYRVSRVFESGNSESRPDPNNYAYLLDVYGTLFVPKLAIRGTHKGYNKYSLNPVGSKDTIKVKNKVITELRPGNYNISLRGSLMKVVNRQEGNYTTYAEFVPSPTVMIQLEANKFYYVSTITNSEETKEWVVLYEVNRSIFRLSEDSNDFEDLRKTDPDFQISGEKRMTIIKSYPPHCVDCKVQKRVIRR